jgi:hypothetical protein
MANGRVFTEIARLAGGKPRRHEKSAAGAEKDASIS